MKNQHIHEHNVNTNGKRSVNGSADKTSSPLISMLLLFAASFIIHTVFNILTKESPTVVIDEGLYTNIARSLAWEGKLAFRSQPVNYPNLLYPFLLVPVYWLNSILGGDIYRIIQVFNTLLITSSVFPVYCFAMDFTKDRNKSYTAAVIVALMPDMLMGGYEMTECLIWPLFIWMIFFCYRFYLSNKLKYGLLTALFTGLLFATKPGAVAAGAVMLIIHLIRSIRLDKNSIVNSVLSLLFLIASVGVVYGVFFLLFGTPDSLLGLYTKQTSEWKSGDTLVAIEATLLLVFLFIFACGGIFGIFPIVNLADYEKPKRCFILSFLLGLLMAVIGTSIFVVPYKWTGELGQLPLHLRYCSMFIPMMYIFTIDRDLESQRPKFLVIALAVFILLSVFPGARAGFVKGNTSTVCSVTLGAFVINSKLNGRVTGWVLTVFSIAFSIFCIFQISVLSKEKTQKKKNRDQHLKRNFCKLGTTGFILFMIFNSICAYVSGNVYIDPTVSRDALEVDHKTAGQECLGITQRYYDDIHSYWLESRLNKPMQQVTVDQMFIKMEETDGIYSPFIPVDQAPNVNNHETPDTNTFVLGMTIAEHMELNDSVITEKTGNGHFTVIQIRPSERWVDTMMYGLDDNALYPGTSGYIHIFDDSRNLDGKVTITLTAYGNGTLNIDGKTIEIDKQAKQYEVTVPYKNLIPVNAENGTVQILSYTTLKR